MSIETAKFLRKSFQIEAVQVTAENIEEVARWCQSVVINSGGGPGPHYIKIRTHNPLTERQTKAFVGDWVLYAGKGYKVYTNKAFNSCFEPVVKTSNMVLQELKSVLEPEEPGMDNVHKLNNAVLQVPKPTAPKVTVND